MAMWSRENEMGDQSSVTAVGYGGKQSMDKTRRVVTFWSSVGTFID